jgi:hypothetical protein
MSRILLAATLAVVACKGGSGSARDGGSTVASGSVPAAAPADAAIAAPVGKVIEVAGQVTVRGKLLAVGDAVTADDVIETDSHGRVVVLLPIDDSHWELGPNQRAKVSEASAWTVLPDAGNRAPDAGVSVDAGAPPSPKKKTGAKTAGTASRGAGFRQHRRRYQRRHGRPSENQLGRRRRSDRTPGVRAAEVPVSGRARSDPRSGERRRQRLDIDRRRVQPRGLDVLEGRHREGQARAGEGQREHDDR